MKAGSGSTPSATGAHGIGSSGSAVAHARAPGRTVAGGPPTGATYRSRSSVGAFTSPSAGNKSKGHGIDALNTRLNASLPAGIPVTYSDRQYTNDLTQALSEARAAYYQAAAPPQSVLDRALYVLRQGGNVVDEHGSILYVLKKQRFFGIEICTGWKVENDGAGAEGGTHSASAAANARPPRAASRPCRQRRQVTGEELLRAFAQRRR